MSKPTTNTDGKNAQHQAKVLQTKGFSKQGSQDIVDGNPPKSAADRARAQGSGDAKAQDQGAKPGLSSSVQKKADDLAAGVASKLRG